MPPIARAKLSAAHREVLERMIADAFTSWARGGLCAWPRGFALLPHMQVTVLSFGSVDIGADAGALRARAGGAAPPT